MDAKQQEEARRLSQYRARLAARNLNARRGIFPDASQAEANGSSGNAGEASDVPYNQDVHKDPMIYRGLYAPSGFDMMSILVRMASRPNPVIQLGAIDSSCSLILCDLDAIDSPIVYVSDPFVALTGYSASEVIGRNCRFLQSPDGATVPGTPRPHTDSKSVWELKCKIGPINVAHKRKLGEMVTESRRGEPLNIDSRNLDESPAEENTDLRQAGKDLKLQEVQLCLKNYKKGGQPFDNLLTIIPIAWEEGGKRRYAVGLQADRAMVLR